MRIGLLADAHGNLAAFDRALGVLRLAGCEEFYFLGDAVGYIVGVGVLERLLEMAIPCLLGNHEVMLCEPDVYDLVAYRLEETRQIMSSRLDDFVRSWPISRTLATPSGKALLVHGSPWDPLHGRLYPDSVVERSSVEPGSTVFMGHTHRPMIREHGGVLYVNVGSCGLPRDDGRFGAACVFNTESGEVRILRFRIDELPLHSGGLSPAVHQLRERRATELVGEIIHE